MENLAAAIAAVVEGDLSNLKTVLAVSHRDLWNAAATLPRLYVSRSALAKVLDGLRSDLFPAEDIQRWASFIRRGYVSGRASGEFLPIEIEYNANDEALIVEIIGRLDEIGDRVDGHIDVCEQEEMLRSLQA